MLDKAWESRVKFMQKTEKDNNQFIGDRFVGEAKNNLWSEKYLWLSKQSDKEQD